MVLVHGHREAKFLSTITSASTTTATAIIIEVPGHSATLRNGPSGRTCLHEFYAA